MDPEQFVLQLKEQGIKLNNRQINQFDTYFHELIAWNNKVNLTRLTSQADVYLKHFYDSLSPAFFYDFTKDLHICDVGAGAGFPSIPLKICFPHIQVTIVDSLQKRIDFLTYLANKLDLEGVSFHHSRAEDFGQNNQFREQFDLVMGRAVARMSVLSELCLPLTKVNGVFIAMKGSQGREELADADKSIKILGGKVKQVEVFTLPKEESERSIIFIDKRSKTMNKYPRKAGTPNKSPL